MLAIASQSHCPGPPDQEPRRKGSPPEMPCIFSSRMASPENKCSSSLFLTATKTLTPIARCFLIHATCNARTLMQLPTQRLYSIQPVFPPSKAKNASGTPPMTDPVSMGVQEAFLIRSLKSFRKSPSITVLLRSPVESVSPV